MLFLSGCSVSHGDRIWSDESETAENLIRVRLVLAGSAVSIFLSSLSQAVSIFCHIGYDLTFWTAGGGCDPPSSAFSAGPVILAGLLAAAVLSGRVSMLSLGEDAARGLGLHVERSRALCLLVVLMLAGAAVALAGPVAFVGLMVPHVVRFVGADYRRNHSLFDGGRGPFSCLR